MLQFARLEDAQSGLSLNGLEIAGRTIKVVFNLEMTKEIIYNFAFYICESNCFSFSMFNYLLLGQKPCQSSPCVLDKGKK